MPCIARWILNHWTTRAVPRDADLTDLNTLGINFIYVCVKSSLVAQLVKNLPAMQETHVQSLRQQDSLETGVATHSSILAWDIPWTKEPGRLQSRGRKEPDMTE